mmetsp:Transcript_5425/g.10389  ORF Transcript_5425/g.10389 Transcript_5425/m.10389 type:complete len:369 (-) Transcript_5425:196-1302(-)
MALLLLLLSMNANQTVSRTSRSNAVAGPWRDRHLANLSSQDDATRWEMNRATLRNLSARGVDPDRFSELFITGLHRNVTNWRLRSIFEDYGRVAECWLSQHPPGFARVRYKDSNRSMLLTAYEKSNGKMLMGQPLRVLLSKDRGPRARRLGEKTKRRTPRTLELPRMLCNSPFTMRIQGLPTDVTWHDLREWIKAESAAFPQWVYFGRNLKRLDRRNDSRLPKFELRREQHFQNGTAWATFGSAAQLSRAIMSCDNKNYQNRLIRCTNNERLLRYPGLKFVAQRGLVVRNVRNPVARRRGVNYTHRPRDRPENKLIKNLPYRRNIRLARGRRQFEPRRAEKRRSRKQEQLFAHSGRPRHRSHRSQQRR